MKENNENRDNNKKRPKRRRRINKIPRRQNYIRKKPAPKENPLLSFAEFQEKLNELSEFLAKFSNLPEQQKNAQNSEEKLNNVKKEINNLNNEQKKITDVVDKLDNLLKEVKKNRESDSESTNNKEDTKIQETQEIKKKPRKRRRRKTVKIPENPRFIGSLEDQINALKKEFGEDSKYQKEIQVLEERVKKLRNQYDSTLKSFKKSLNFINDVENFANSLDNTKQDPLALFLRIGGKIYSKVQKRKKEKEQEDFIKDYEKKIKQEQESINELIKKFKENKKKEIEAIAKAKENITKEVTKTKGKKELIENSLKKILTVLKDETKTQTAIKPKQGGSEGPKIISPRDVPAEEQLIENKPKEKTLFGLIDKLEEKIKKIKEQQSRPLIDCCSVLNDILKETKNINNNVEKIDNTIKGYFDYVKRKDYETSEALDERTPTFPSFGGEDSSKKEITGAIKKLIEKQKQESGIGDTIRDIAIGYSLGGNKVGGTVKKGRDVLGRIKGWVGAKSAGGKLGSLAKFGKIGAIIGAIGAGGLLFKGGSSPTPPTPQVPENITPTPPPATKAPTKTPKSPLDIPKAVPKYGMNLKNMFKVPNFIKGAPALLKKIPKRAPLLGIILTAGQVYENIKRGEDVSRAITKGIGSLGGGLLGGFLGGSAGTFLGGPAGSIVGGLAGYTAGEAIGQNITEKLYDFLTGKENKPKVIQTQARSPEQTSQIIKNNEQLSALAKVFGSEELAIEAAKVAATEGGLDSKTGKLLTTSINKQSQAAGAFQFLPSTALELAEKTGDVKDKFKDLLEEKQKKGMTKELREKVAKRVAELSMEEQAKMYMNFIAPIIKNKEKNTVTAEELKAFGFAPIISKLNDSDIVYRQNSIQVKQNPYLDLDKSGDISKKEIIDYSKSLMGRRETQFARVFGSPAAQPPSGGAPPRQPDQPGPLPGRPEREPGTMVAAAPPTPSRAPTAPETSRTLYMETGRRQQLNEQVTFADQPPVVISMNNNNLFQQTQQNQDVRGVPGPTRNPDPVYQRSLETVVVG